MPESATLDIPLSTATARDLIDAYLGALDGFADIADSLEADEWDQPSPCPGWTTADVVAHVAAIELELHGEPLPDHEPDWESLPHVETQVDQYIERPVDMRRGVSRDRLLGELHEVAAWRADDLRREPQDLGETITGPGGWQLTREALLRVRTFDIWVHEQDIRTAVDRPGNLSGDAAWITAGQLLIGMPRVWAKLVGMQTGASIRLRVTGPGVAFDRVIIIGEDGRARFVEQPPADERLTTTVTMSWPAFLARATGRPGFDQTGGESIHVEGDAELGTAFTGAMTVTF